MDQNSASPQNPPVNTATQSNPMPVMQPVVSPTPPATIQPISGPKEYVPSSNQPIAAEIVKPTETEPIISPEVKEAGAEVVPNSEHIDIKTELKEAGVEPIKTAAPVLVAPTGSIVLPMTEEEAIKTIKTAPPTFSARWLATEVTKHLLRVHKLLTKEKAS